MRKHGASRQKPVEQRGQLDCRSKVWSSPLEGEPHLEHAVEVVLGPDLAQSETVVSCVCETAITAV